MRQQSGGGNDLNGGSFNLSAHVSFVGPDAGTRKKMARFATGAERNKHWLSWYLGVFTSRAMGFPAPSSATPRQSFGKGAPLYVHRIAAGARIAVRSVVRCQRGERIGLGRARQFGKGRITTCVCLLPPYGLRGVGATPTELSRDYLHMWPSRQEATAFFTLVSLTEIRSVTTWF